MSTTHHHEGATTMPTTTRQEIIWERSRDKYGRGVQQLDRVTVDANGLWIARERNLAVVVTMPKATRDMLPGAYLVNVRGDRGPISDRITYHPTMAAAKRHALASV